MKLERLQHHLSRTVLRAALCGGAQLLSASLIGGTASASPVRPHVPAHGYDAKWYFNGNDGLPNVKFTVTAAGAFNFHYLPAYCKGAGFTVKGRFESTAFKNVPFQQEFASQHGYLVDFTSAGSCRGSQPGNDTNTFTWTKARGISYQKWPNTRGVIGITTQTACVTGSGCGTLDIDWNMGAL